MNHSFSKTDRQADAIGSRFEPGEGTRASRYLRSLAGPFLDELRRAVLSETQRDMAWFICRCTLSRGRQRVIFDSLDEAGQFLKLPRSRVHPVVFGEFAGADGAWLPGVGQDYAPRLRVESGELRERKMANCRLFSFEEFNDGRRGRWLVTVWPDVNLWNVAWRWPAGALSVAVGALEAKPGQLTPFVPALAPAADLHDARAITAADAAAAVAQQAIIAADAAAVAGRCARVDSIGRVDAARSVDGAGSAIILNNSPGALVRPMDGGVRAWEVWRSGKGNGGEVDGQGDGRGVPEKGTALSIGIGSKEGSSLPIGREEREWLKGKLHGDEREFCEAACRLIGARNWNDGRREHWQGDGSKWRARWRHGASRDTVLRAFLDLLERPTKKAAGAVENRWQEFGGETLDAARLKSKESLSNQ